MKSQTLCSIAITLVVALASAVPAHATFPGKNGRIAFGQTTGPTGADIFTMNPDGSDPRQLTFLGSNSGGTFLGDWSPDGSVLVFSHYASPSTPNSPDGTKIVFPSDRLSNNFGLDLFIMNADGSGLHRIASGLTAGGCPDTNCVTPSWGPKP